MGITLAIVGGLIVMTVVSVYFDYLGKKAKNADPGLERRIAQLEKRIELLDAAMADKDESIKRLTDEVGFVNKLLDKRS